MVPLPATAVPASPQQKDGYSCGSFAMVAVHMLLEGKLMEQLDDPPLEAGHWFTNTEAETARVWLRRCLYNLHTEHKDASICGPLSPPPNPKVQTG